MPDRASDGSERTQPSQFYSILEKATEYLIYGVMIFTPWAFGTTERWAINSVNDWNYVLGLLLAGKWMARWRAGAKWEWPWQKTDSQEKAGSYGVCLLASLTAAILAITAIAAWNARAQFLFQELRFEYFEDYIPWLPYSYDRPRTWEAFRLYLAAACFFWALRDWLLGKDTKLRQSGRRHSRSRHESSSGRASARTNRLLWVICINGSLLALQAILQRLSGSHQLLWLVQPRWNKWAEWQFGPFNYRTNGAQYLNMIWPVSLGLWWTLNRRRTGKFGNDPSSLLLPLMGLMIAGPIIANSRGGMIIDVLQVLGTIVIVVLSAKRMAWWKTALLLGACVAIVAGTAALQWESIQVRFSEKTLETLTGRKVIYENAKKITADFPFWGSGPGTFAAVYQLYRDDPNQTWFAFAHDDYLQTLATFGRVGLALILGAVATIAFISLRGSGIPEPAPLVGFLWLSVVGCLAHAKFDFPFQIYSLLLLFITLCCVLSCCHASVES